MAAFAAVDQSLLDASRTLGASEARGFLSGDDPGAAPGLAAGTALALGRALGEFGATLMFAGLLPGHHADRAARNLRPLLDGLRLRAGAVGRACGRVGAILLSVKLVHRGDAFAGWQAE